MHVIEANKTRQQYHITNAMRAPHENGCVIYSDCRIGST